MKQKTFCILSLVFLIVSISGCSSLGKAEADTPAGPEAQSVSENVLELPDGWKYETEITHEGSRSEGSVGRLFYRYNEIPAVYNRIVIDDVSFGYIPMVNQWDNRGYVEAEIPAAQPEYSDAITQEELKRGWYLADYSAKKTGTPKVWVWADSGRLSMWISPSLLNDFAELNNLRSVDSGPQLMKSAD